jgi:hypothetical protein
MKRCEKITKTVQRRVYDFLLTKYGIALIVIGALLIIVSTLQLSDTILEYKLSELKNLSFLKSRNTASISDKFKESVIRSDDYLDFSGSFEGSSFKTNIDVVYTWVNGSDPAHLALLKKHKLNEKDSNKNLKKFLKISFDEFYEKLINTTIPSLKPHKKDDEESQQKINSIKNENESNYLPLWPCFHKLCMQTNNLIIILPQLKQNDKLSFLLNAKSVFSTELFSNITIDNVDQIYHNNDNLNIQNQTNSKYDSSLSILYINNYDFKSDRKVLDLMRDLFRKELVAKDYKLFMGYYTIDCSLAMNCIQNIDRTFIAKKIKSNLFIKQESGPAAIKFNQYGYLDNIGKYF